MEEMIEKQITLLIPKSQVEQFEEISNGFREFTLNQYCEESNLDSAVKSKSLILEITSTKILC
jgi:hypothetical protein